VSKEITTWNYDSSKRPPHPIDELKQAIRYRNLIFQLLYRDITTRYKRSVLGIAWTMINPLGTMLVMAVAFSQIFGATKGYPAYVLSGYLAWTFFSQTTTAAIVNLVWGGGLIQRVYMPRTSFALAATGTGIVNLALAIIPLVIVEILIGVEIKWTILFLPIPMILMAMFALGFGLLISSFAVYFPDVAEMYQIILNAWFYLTPIVYPESALPSTVRFWLFRLNPVYRLITLFRNPIYDGVIPSWHELWPTMLIAVFTLVIGWWFFAIKSDEFAYRI
jgi:ABC-type polysaccharide/polyol phosphate export permease